MNAILIALVLIAGLASPGRAAAQGVGQPGPPPQPVIERALGPNEPRPAAAGPSPTAPAAAGALAAGLKENGGRLPHRGKLVMLAQNR